VKAATWPRAESAEERLLVVDPGEGDWLHARVGDLPRHLRRGDLLVVNDAATLPASLIGTTAAGDRIEVRLAARLDEGRWQAVTFGDGDWRTPTEKRGAAPAVAPGQPIVFGPDLKARVEEVDRTAPRLVVLAFDGGDAHFWSALYRHGRPVQYAHVPRPLELWHVQTPFAERPWAVEMPSAGRPLSWRLVQATLGAGVRLAAITHAAGLSSTGDAALDARLPLPERFDVPERTASAIRATRASGGRIVAVGTTVVRALEGCAARAAARGGIATGEGTTDLRVDRSYVPRVVDGLLTGLHPPGSSHHELLRAFAPAELLERAWTAAETAGYVEHEFGDACLVLAGSLA
jgi:S-adenosylmethionine:tRNA ribosyltransferase-isomerase